MNVLHDVAEDHIQTSGDSKRSDKSKSTECHQRCVHHGSHTASLEKVWNFLDNSCKIQRRISKHFHFESTYHTCCAGLEGKILNCHCDHYCYGRGDHHNRNGRLL